MADREKVIKGLKIHTKPNSRCVGCPYPNNGLCGDQLYMDALVLLKEQEPVSVAGPDNYEEYWDREAICPDCGTHWMSYDKNGKRITKYCPGCGRLVKWQ